MRWGDTPTSSLIEDRGSGQQQYDPTQMLDPATMSSPYYARARHEYLMNTVLSPEARQWLKNNFPTTLPTTPIEDAPTPLPGPLSSYWNWSNR